MAPILEYQDWKSRCLNPGCTSQGKKKTVEYRLSCIGPWMLEKETATCAECGQVYHLWVEVLQDGRARVHVEVSPTAR